MGYSEDDSMVRVDFFKPSGKWYATEAVKWTGKYKIDNEDPTCDGWDIKAQFAKSLRDHFKKTGKPQRLCDMIAVCLHPCHINEHPIMFREGRWLNEKYND